jgi:hypothetical protein
MDLRIMSNKPEAAKLTALRAKTDGQLIALINHQLNRGLEADFTQAEQIHSEVSRLLPVVYGASPAERRRIESRLATLRESIQPRAFVA